jgi:GH15 family glucan-1,4-alpha-glucosidase
MASWSDQPLIEDYGLLGDTRTAALVSCDGAIDWLCTPSFDGEPLFGRLIGGHQAGTFRLGPSIVAPVRSRRYRPRTATLETTWDTAGGRLTLTEGMVAEVAGQMLPTTLLVRQLTADDGPVEATIEFDPRFGEAHRVPRLRRHGHLVVSHCRGTAIALQVDPYVPVEPGRLSTVVITPGRPVTVVLAVATREPLVFVPPAVAWAALEADEDRWRRWCQDVDEGLPERDAVLRSLLTLRLLTHSPSGAPVAAPTTSLPEQLGGVRNWDYRFAWPRDASIGVGAFLGVGKQAEALRFMAWLLKATRLDRPRLPVLLTLYGKRPAPERNLVGWPGYAGSVPVRVGNDAASQHQLDGYGWVVDAAWLLTRSGQRLDGETVRTIAGLADTVAARWPQPDAGIWELRGVPMHHVHSKLMAWLALDRALRIAEHRRIAGRRTSRWRAARELLGVQIKERGVDPARGIYTRAYGSADLDAAVLVLPLLDIEPPDSVRVRSTVDAIHRDLDAGWPLLYRYRPGQDGLPGAEGAFVPCSFWLVQALARTGRADEALQLFEALVNLGGPLGLFPEEMDPANHRYLGNFPQALSHAALVQAALALRDAGRP